MNVSKNFTLVLLALTGLGAAMACEPEGKGADTPSVPLEQATPAPASAQAPTPAPVPATAPAVAPSSVGADTKDPPAVDPPPKNTVDLPAPISIPATILPAGCTVANEDAGPWDGHKQFSLECQAPSTKGWTKVATADSYGGGSANRSHAYRKDGWMMLFGERCCSACEPDKLTECVPWFSARLYPPSDLKDCAHSKVCGQVGLCVQKKGWCEGADEDWGLSM